MRLEAKVKVAPKEEKTYGSLHVTQKDLPAISKADIGGTMELTITVKVKGLREVDNWEIREGDSKAGEVRADLAITKIEHKNKTK